MSRSALLFERGAKGRCPPTHSSSALTRATGLGTSSIFDHGYLLQRACLLTECYCVVRRFPALWRRVCVLVNKFAAILLASVLVSFATFPGVAVHQTSQVSALQTETRE